MTPIYQNIVYWNFWQFISFSGSYGIVASGNGVKISKCVIRNNDGGIDIRGKNIKLTFIYTFSILKKWYIVEIIWMKNNIKCSKYTKI